MQTLSWAWINTKSDRLLQQRIINLVYLKNPPQIQQDI